MVFAFFFPPVFFFPFFPFFPFFFFFFFHFQLTVRFFYYLISILLFQFIPLNSTTGIQVEREKQIKTTEGNASLPVILLLLQLVFGVVTFEIFPPQTFCILVQLQTFLFARKHPLFYPGLLTPDLRSPAHPPLVATTIATVLVACECPGSVISDCWLCKLHIFGRVLHHHHFTRPFYKWRGK